MLLVRKQCGDNYLLVGSANMTRRNLDNFNLETSVMVRAPDSADVIRDATDHFDLLWNNSDEQTFSVPYEQYRNDSTVMKCLYRFQERSGWGTF